MDSQDCRLKAELPAEAAMIAAASGGDAVALQQLLLKHYDRLARRVAARLPPRLQATLAVEDVLQQTFCQVFRDIGRFEQRDVAAFGDWLSQIADNRLFDAIRHHDRVKRGGGLRRLDGEAGDDSRILSLLDRLAGDDISPSSVVARGEAVHALQLAMAALPNDQREAIRWRVLDGKSLEETAAALGRTPDAVRGLVHRGKQQLQAAMGRASQWLSAK
jgi:RNA polymerase sigma-70 factor, ECF subfamily